MTTGTNTNQQGAGCLTLFALPFCGVGLWLAYDVVGRFAWGVEDWQQLTLILIAALVFGGGGFGLLIWSRIAAGKLAEEARLKAVHPDQPWMWKPGWASGRIEGSSRATMTLAWVMAFFTTVLSAPTVISIPEEVIDKGNHPALLGLVFPLAAIGFVIWGLRATARWRKFSVSVFQMSAVPGVVGGRLRGTIQSGLQSPPEEGVGLSLTCVHQRRDSESNRSMHESILWQDQRTVGREHLYAGLPGLTFPVDFYVPFECRETDEPDSGSKVVWRLEATAKVAGIDYRTQFEVPVFKTPASSPEPPEEGAFTFRSEVKKEFDPKTATIAVRLSAGGGTEYFFPAARNVGAALSVTTFLLIFAGAIWLQLHLEIFLLLSHHDRPVHAVDVGVHGRSMVHLKPRGSRIGRGTGSSLDFGLSNDNRDPVRGGQRREVAHRDAAEPDDNTVRPGILRHRDASQARPQGDRRARHPQQARSGVAGRADATTDRGVAKVAA